MIDGQPLTFAGKALAPGTPVVVIFSRWFDAYLKSEWDAEAQAAQQRDEQRKQEERDRRDRCRDEAQTFNSSILLPVKWDVGVNTVLSGLSEKSWGDGRYSKTVNHIMLLEPLKRGRLNREAKAFLCGSKRTGRFRDRNVERSVDGEGNEYVPKVTCKRCLEIAERMKHA